jgi:hypothetical protein
VTTFLSFVFGAVMTRSQWRSTLCLGAVLASCVAPTHEPPARADARATIHWAWSSNRAQYDDPDAVWEWRLVVVLPDDDVECDLWIKSDPRLVEGGWIEPRARVGAVRSDLFDERTRRQLALLEAREPKLVSPRPYYLIDNPGMRFRWIDPTESKPIEPAQPLPEPPNSRVPRVVTDRLATLRNSSGGRALTLAIDDVVMQWALPYLRSELADSGVP